MSKNFLFISLVLITTIDASRIFYLPLPKIHSSYHELKSSPIVQKASKQEQEGRSISDEFIPISTMERRMYDEQEEDEKRDAVDWESLFNERPRHHIPVKERSRFNDRKLDYLLSSDEETQALSKTNSNDDTEAAIDRLSQSNGNLDTNEPWIVDEATARSARLQSDDGLIESERKKRRSDALFLVIVGTCSLVGILGLVAAAIFWYKIQKRAEAALDTEYPSYGVTGPGNNGTKISPSTTMSDRKLAQSAQMYHYQQQRQQMMAQEKAHLDTKPVHSDDSDDETPNGGDYTVYECPGLAPTGEMEVRNPLFAESDSSLTSSTFASHPTTNNHYPQPATSTPSASSPPKENSLS